MLTRLPTDPFVAEPGCIKSIRGEGVTKRTDGTTFVIIATHGPLEFIAIGLMGAQINDAPSTETVMRTMERL